MSVLAARSVSPVQLDPDAIRKKTVLLCCISCCPYRSAEYIIMNFFVFAGAVVPLLARPWRGV